MKGQETYVSQVRAQLSKDYPDIQYFDYNYLTKTGAIRFNRDFADQTHVNISGAQTVSTDMGKRLVAILEER